MSIRWARPGFESSLYLRCCGLVILAKLSLVLRLFDYSRVWFFHVEFKGTVKENQTRDFPGNPVVVDSALSMQEARGFDLGGN